MTAPTMKFTMLTNAAGMPHPGKSYAMIGETVEKNVNGEYQLLNARTISTDLAGLKQLIDNSTPDQHLVAGVPAVDGQLAPIGNGAGLPSRCNDDLKRPIGPGLLVIDSDELNGEPVWQHIIAACPLMAGHARVEASSTGANLFKGKQRLTGEKGQHTFLHAADASDIPRAMEVLHKRLILVGHGRYKVSKTGEILSRSLVDIQMRVPSQPIYLRPTLIGLTQKKRVEFFPGNEVIDTRLCVPDLTAEEEAAFLQADAAARAALKDEAEATATAYDEERGKALPGGAAEARAARLGRRLPNDWVVTLSDGSDVTVGAILADPEKYHGKACRDPLEPDYGSKTVAKIYVKQDAPLINSNAHGGRFFHLGTPVEAGMFSPLPAKAGEGPRPIVESFVRRPFPLAALPPLVAAAVMDVQYHVQCPVALAVGSALTAMSMAAMGHVDAVRSNKLTGPCGLIVVEIADSGERKTAADKWFTLLVHAHEVNKEIAHREAMGMYENELKIWKVKEAAAKKIFSEPFKKADMEKDGGFKAMPNDAGNPDEVEKKYRAFLLKNPMPGKPVRQKMLYDSATSEVMYSGIGRWPLMAILSNEAGSFFGSRAMGSDSAMATLSLLNKMWDGERIVKDTKGNGEDFCARPRGTAHLMAQEGIFRSFLDAGNGQARDIGAIARFLLCQPETTKGTRFFREDGGTFGIDTFNHRIAELMTKPITLDSQGFLVTRLFHPSQDAKDVWIAFYNKIESALGPGGKYSGIPDIASKIAENASRLATVFAFTVGENVVSAETMNGACVVAEWYLDEMLAYLGDDVEPEVVKDARAMEHSILTLCIKARRAGFTTLREVKHYIPSRAMRKSESRLERALSLLLQQGRARVEKSGNSIRVFPHPEIMADALAKLEVA